MTENEREVLLGSLLGDGGIHRRSVRSFRFVIGNTKKGYIEEVDGLLPSFRTKHVHSNPRKPPRQPLHTVRMSIGPISQPDCLEDISEWYSGFYGDKTRKHRIPEWLEPTCNKSMGGLSEFVGSLRDVT